MVYVERPVWMDNFSGENTEWLVYVSGRVRYVRAVSQEQALEKAVKFFGADFSSTNDIRPRVGRRRVRLMSEIEFAKKLRSLVE